MACHKEPPFTAEQVAWIDQRIAAVDVQRDGFAVRATTPCVAPREVASLSAAERGLISCQPDAHPTLEPGARHSG